MIQSLHRARRPAGPAVGGRVVTRVVVVLGLAVAFVLGAGVARPARAGYNEAAPPRLRLELGVAGGVHLFANDLELGVADDPSLPSPKDGGEIALRAALYFHPMLGVEVEAGWIPSSDNQHDYRLFIIGWRAHAIVELNRWRLMQGKLTPFALAGFGALQVASTVGTAYDEIKKDTDMELHVGAGAKYALTPTLAARFDARVYAVPNTTANGSSPDFEFLAGLAFTPRIFSRRAAAPAPVAVPAPAPAAAPAGPGRDSDGDGIADERDRCPKAGEDRDGFRDEDGCPDPDNDGDGIPDIADECPNEPETPNGFEDEDGCPDEVPAAVAKFTGVVDGITFGQSSANITRSSYPLLDRAVKVLKDYPDLRIEIAGHTSNEGKLDFNMKLSQKRAESVRAYLLSAGIDARRTKTVGYGPQRPIADNHDDAGKEKNRRIEFHLIQRDGAGAAKSAPAHPPAAPRAPTSPPPMLP
jgi:OOP family OmpA-OmpF porin